MENNIELFDKYILEQLSPEETVAFESKLKIDTEFAQDFRLYLYTINGIQKEAEQENIEFGHAVKKISKAKLLEIIGRKSQPKILRLSYMRERLAWTSSLAAILVIGFLTVFFINRSNQYQYDNLIVEYNYIYADKGTDEAKDITAMTDKEIKEMLPTLIEDFHSSNTDDLQEAETAGMRLAMAYLKLHNRKAALQVLENMTKQFADDEEFVAQCNRIISQLK